MPTRPIQDLEPLRRGLNERLNAFRRQVRRHLVIEGAARLIIEVVVAALVTLLLDRWLRLSLTMRLSLLSLLVVGLGVETWRWIIAPLRLRLSGLDLAGLVDRRRVALNGHAQTTGAPIAPRVAAVLQLPNLLAEKTVSPAMIERAVRRASESLDEVDFHQHLDPARRRNALIVTAGALLLALAIGLAFPQTTGLWARRWFLASNIPWPQKTYLDVVGVTDGVLLVPRGEPYVLRVAPREGSVVPETVNLRLRPQNGKPQSATMSWYGEGGDFRHELLSVGSPITITGRGGDDILEPFVIQPIDRPRVARLELTAQHPLDAAPTVIDFSGHSAAASFLPRTAMQLLLTANVPLSDVKLTSATTRPAAPDLVRVDETHYRLAWEHNAPVSINVELVGAVGGLTSPPTPISIGLRADNAPRLSLRHSGVRQRITPSAHIPLTLLARDDFGLATLGLDWSAEVVTETDAAPTRRSASIDLAGPFDPATELEIQQTHTLDVAPLFLAAGAILSLEGRASDACYLGAQEGRSSALLFRVVAPEELFREILLRQQNERAQFRRALDEAKELQEQLLTLASPASAQQLARRHRLLQRDVARSHKSISDLLTEMKLNELGAPEAYDLMESNILAPLLALHDGAMAAQRDTLDQLGLALDEAALATAAAQQEAIVAEMETILRQMAQWDSFVDVLNQLNEIIRLQGQARESAEQLRTRQTEGLFDE